MFAYIISLNILNDSWSTLLYVITNMLAIF
jgi:hypothetical protein